MTTEVTTKIFSFEQARALVEDYATQLPPPDVEELALLDCDGRVLAEEVRADRDFPPFARVTRDGFALRAADLVQVPARLKVVGEVAAGVEGSHTLRPGEAIEIMTGARLPEGADAVVMVEHTRRQGDAVVIDRQVRSGENFVPRGVEAHAGDLLLATRQRMNPAAIAIAASVGKASLRVFHRPVVAIVATGDELVEVHGTPGAAQIRNSNSYSIAAQVNRAGGEPLMLPIARDSEDSIRAALHEAKSAELLILSGGVSMGKYDLVEIVLSSEGAAFHMTGARIQPGKPVVFGTLPGEGHGLPFFGLPGNPISTMVTFDLFVAPVLQALAGANVSPLRFAQARMGEDLRVASGLTRFLPAVLSGTSAESHVSLVPWHGSGDLAAIVRANCYLVVPPEATSLARDTYVSVLLKD